MRWLLLVLALGSPVLGMAGVSDRVETLERRMEAVTELLLDVDRLKRENSELRGQVELLKYELEQLKTQQRELYLDIERRLSGDGGQTAAEPSAPSAAPEPMASEPAPPAPVAGSGTTAEAGAGDEVQAYQAAYELLLPQKKYPEAIAAFRTFLGNYPNGEYADNAQFWLGEAHYANRDYDQAITEFQKLAEAYPTSPKVPDALLKVGYIRYAQGNYDKAREVFNGLIQHYPGTSAAHLAQQRLDAIAGGR